MQKFFNKNLLIFLAVFFVTFLIITYYLQSQLITIYESQKSPVLLDRNNEIISILPNSKGYYNYYTNPLPKNLKKLLIKNEDRFFYYHPGFNPVSIIRAGLDSIGLDQRIGASTITQQLTKNLLGNELDRSIKNKIIETIYAIALETYFSKEEILEMYINSLYLGNSIQGIRLASQAYFALPPEFLSQSQFIQLLATINSPSTNNPLKPANNKFSNNLSKRLNVSSSEFNTTEQIKANYSQFQPIKTAFFEISPLIKKGKSTIDLELTNRIREIVKRNIDELKAYNANNAAVIVIKIPENEILAIIGSPAPNSLSETYKIDMLHQPRPIGSTIKPFIYAKAFEKNLRPYTLIDDREYKYITAISLPLYPKNFDFKYRGIVTLHYALSNSLNVPAVKVLEYVGLENFYNFLLNDLDFSPIQDLNEYQLGIALGSLEMKLIDLAQYFTVFPNKGILKEIKIIDQQKTEKRIIEEKYVQLINKILSDRKTGMEQFGLKSELNLTQNNYALKTGTSRDFRDSWIVGYTPDFLTAVWVGNADNSPTEKLSGQTGAGRIWHEIMELLFNTQYNKKTEFNSDLIYEFNNQREIEYGLKKDNYEEFKNILISQDKSLILLPHDGDVFFLENNTQIILKAREDVAWFVNGSPLKSEVFLPQKAGIYEIVAENKNGFREALNIQILD